MLDDLKNPDGTKMFARTDSDMSDNIDGYKLYRKVLAGEPDNSVKIILNGKFMYQIPGGDDWYAQQLSILRRYTVMRNKVR